MGRAKRPQGVSLLFLRALFRWEAGVDKFRGKKFLVVGVTGMRENKPAIERNSVHTRMPEVVHPVPEES